MILHSRHIAANVALRRRRPRRLVDGVDGPSEGSELVRPLARRREVVGGDVHGTGLDAARSGSGARDLRAAPGRATEWQRTLDRLAAERDMSLIFCMATPGDYFTDRRAASGSSPCARATTTASPTTPARLWRWYLTNNLLAAVARRARRSRTASSPTTIDDGADDPARRRSATRRSRRCCPPSPPASSALATASAGPTSAIIERLVDDDGRVVTSETPIVLRPESFFDVSDAVDA